MTEHFVTHFNSGFLLQGMALYLSMKRQMHDFTLWIVCLDDEVGNTLNKLRLSNIRVLEKESWQTKELKILRENRTFREYCWTITPSLPKFVFKADDSIKRVTYLDADLWFRKNPRLIFDEFTISQKAILITDHHYAPEFDQSAISGQYCVQFMIFVRDNCELVRSKWENQCKDWCYEYPEDGKFGDQKYLDTWPSQYADHVHLLSEQTAILAPWNATRFPYGNSVIWHFHGINISRQRDEIIVDYGYAPIPYVTTHNVYEAYIDDLKKAASMLGNDVIEYLPQRERKLLSILKAKYKRVYFRLLRLDCHKIVKI